jgi:hypothetical protein
MSWVGLRDARGGVFSQCGLGRASRAPFNLSAVMPSGTLMFEFASDPRGRVQTLVDYGSTHPWAAGLRVTLDQNGVLTLFHWQGTQARRYTLETGLVCVTLSIVVTYTWDAPMRRGVLAVQCPDHNVMLFSEISAPLPLSMRDGMRMMADKRHCRINSNAAFVALADEVMPIGQLPTLGADVLIPTPEGSIAISDIRAGQMIVTSSGKLAQVRWAGAATLPARGRFAPLTMRAPYHGLRQDMTVAHDQQLRIQGPEVEYLFHTDQISLRVGDLRDGIAVRQSQRALTKDYWQILLDQPEPIAIGSMHIEAMDISAIRKDPALKAHSVLAGIPPELIPSAAAQPRPVLKPYETHSLQKLRVA